MIVFGFIAYLNFMQILFKKAFALILTNPIFAVQNKLMFWK